MKPGSRPTKVGKGGAVKLDDVDGENETIAVHLRLEWGDWYVASVGRATMKNKRG
jgi:hypothetical protein